MLSSVSYRNYAEYIPHDAESAKRMIQDAKEFFDEFPEHPVFHCIAGPNHKRYAVSRKGITYKVMPGPTS